MKFKNMSIKNKLLVTLLLIMIVYTSLLVYAQSIIGVNYWDIFVYLQNAMLFSHVNIGSQLSVPPILSLIVSIPFLLGARCELTLFVVSGIFFILLIIGIYLLFNKRYTPIISFIGSLFFSMLSLVITWAVSGSNDLPSLTFIVWAIIFTIEGKDKFNYLYLAFICFILAFFTRFTAGFVLLIIIGYILMNFKTFINYPNRQKIRNLLIFIVIIATIISAIYLIKQGTIPFLNQFIEVSQSSQVSTVNVGYELNPYYYIEYMPQFLTSTSIAPTYDMTLTTVNNTPTILSYIILILASLGIILVFKPLKNFKTYTKKNTLIFIITILIGLITLITYMKVSYIITELLFIIFLITLYHNTPEKFNQIDIIMLLLLGVFMILHSYHPVKVDRYIIATFIPIIYFMIKAITSIPHKNKKIPITILIILLTILIPISTSYTISLTHPNEHTTEEKNAATWLEKYDPNYMNHNISSDRGVAFSWYLKKYTYTTIPRVLQTNNQTLTNSLKSINAKYYIDTTSNTTYINGYHIIYNNNNTENKVKIYQRN